METHKTIFANIFDPESGEYSPKILLLIDFIPPADNSKLSHFEVVGKFKTWQPQFDKKTLMLEINPSLKGFAYFESTGLSPKQTQYRIVLQDSVWLNVDWFNNLDAL